MSCPSDLAYNQSTKNSVEFNSSSELFNLSAEESSDLIFQNEFQLSFLLFPLQWSISFIGILGNILVLLIYKRRQEKSPSEIFIVTMSILDIAMCFSSIFFTAAKDFLFPKNCFLFCSAGNVAFDSVNTASSILTFIICINRYFAVCNPHSYRSVFADEKTLLILLICILLSAANCPIGLLMCAKFREGANLPCACDQVIYAAPKIDVLKLLWVVIRTLMLMVNAVTMVYVYPRIFCNMRERSRRMRKLTSFPAVTSTAVKYCNGMNNQDKMTAVVSICVLTQGCSSGNDKEKIANELTDVTNSKLNIKVHRDGKLTSTLVTVTIAYVTLLTPDIIVHVIDTFALLDNSQFDVIRTITQTLYLLNFVINPFIHYWVNSYFKSEVQRRFLGCRSHSV